MRGSSFGHFSDEEEIRSLPSRATTALVPRAGSAAGRLSDTCLGKMDWTLCVYAFVGHGMAPRRSIFVSDMRCRSPASAIWTYETHATLYRSFRVGRGSSSAAQPASALPVIWNIGLYQPPTSLSLQYLPHHPLKSICTRSCS